MVTLLKRQKKEPADQPKAEDQAIADLKALLAARHPVPPAPVQEAQPDAGPGIEWQPEGGTEADNLVWKRKPEVVLTTMVSCVVIDRFSRWHEGVKVDLHGMDTTGFTWGNYGSSFPVLVEDDGGKLQPWYLPDTVGESSNRLYKAANPEGFRNTFKHRSTMLHKIQVGLMVALVLGLFFLMFILTNQ